jgi:2-keto-3-deoxy-6-phosphogluconate aldolase
MATPSEISSMVELGASTEKVFSYKETKFKKYKKVK